MSNGDRTVRWIHNGTVRLAIAEYGDPAAPPIVALHGFPESSLTWERLAERIVAAGRRLVAPDLRGFGLSDAPRWVRSYRMELLLDDVAAVIDDLGNGPVELLAHDWGGGLAWLIAERRPHLITRATILNVPHPGVLRRAVFRDPEQRRRSSYIVKMQVPLLPERRLSRDRGGVLASLFPAEHYSQETIEQYRDQWSRPGGVRGMLNWYRSAARDRSLRPPRDPIVAPVAIIWGKDDPLFAPSLVEESVALCSDATMTFVECGHAPHRELPDRVASLMLDGEG